MIIGDNINLIIRCSFRPPPAEFLRSVGHLSFWDPRRAGTSSGTHCIFRRGCLDLAHVGRNGCSRSSPHGRCSSWSFLKKNGTNYSQNNFIAPIFPQNLPQRQVILLQPWSFMNTRPQREHLRRTASLSCFSLEK